jgi:hypothetical protein
MIHQGLGVAVIAAQGDFLAPDPGIERVIAPFNVAVLTHDNAPDLKIGSPMNRATRRSLSLYLWSFPFLVKEVATAHAAAPLLQRSVLQLEGMPSMKRQTAARRIDGANARGRVAS